LVDLFWWFGDSIFVLKDAISINDYLFVNFWGYFGWLNGEFGLYCSKLGCEIDRELKKEVGVYLNFNLLVVMHWIFFSILDEWLSEVGKWLFIVWFGWLLDLMT